jgi:hypothetical protein
MNQTVRIHVGIAGVARSNKEPDGPDGAGMARLYVRPRQV